MVPTVGLEPRKDDITYFATLRLNHWATPPYDAIIISQLVLLESWRSSLHARSRSAGLCFVTTISSRVSCGRSAAVCLICVSPRPCPYFTGLEDRQSISFPTGRFTLRRQCRTNSSRLFLVTSLHPRRFQLACSRLWTSIPGISGVVWFSSR